VNNPLLFMLAVVTVLGTLGPTNTLLATSGAISGIRASLSLLAGELAGYLAAITAYRIALEPMLSVWPQSDIALKIGAAIYLIWMAARLWFRGPLLDRPGTFVSLPNLFFTTLLNPKALIFSAIILPKNDPHLSLYFIAFSASVIAVGLCWIIAGRAIGLAAGAGYGVLLPRLAATALVGFAGLILMSSIR
jgi:threonine/homoserine/homoserine lactone efflux protein